MEFLASKESQAWYAQANNEFPVREDVAWSDSIKQWGEFKADNLSLAKLGENNADAVRLMDRVRWK